MEGLMATNLKDIFDTTQSSLRQNPTEGAATFAAATRQLTGLRSEAAIRDFRLTLDEPQALGGSDAGPNPVELVLAALGACQEITYRLYAESLGIPLNHVAVKVEGRVDLRGFFAAADGVRPGFRDIRATVEIDSPASPQDIERLKATVDLHCPVLDILRNVTPTKLELVHNAARHPVAA
jgi:putative redox protein